MVAHDVGLERRAVEIQPDAGGAAGAVVGHHEAGPGVQRKRSPGPDGDGVAGPEMNQPEERPAVIQRQLEAAAAGIRPGARLVQDDGAILRSVGLRRRLNENGSVRTNGRTPG